MSDGNDSDAFSGLDDVAFLDERRRVREALELVPAHERPAELVSRYQRLTEEFDRRAAAAWTGGGRAGGGR
jgi:hypothetical protein